MIPAATDSGSSSPSHAQTGWSPSVEVKAHTQTEVSICEVAEWLRAWKLDRFVEVFAREGVNSLEVVKRIVEEDIEDWGVGALWKRSLMVAVRALQDGHNKPPLEVSASVRSFACSH